MKIKVSKHKLNIHHRGSPRGSRTQQLTRTAYVMQIPTHRVSPRQETTASKNSNSVSFQSTVTSHALFYGGHLVIRSKRRAVQNQEITLTKNACVKA